MSNFFGEKLTEIRSEKKLSMQELAEKSGISQSYISQIENGKTPNSKLISKLSKGLASDENEKEDLKSTFEKMKNKDEVYSLLDNLEKSTSKLKENDFNFSEIPLEKTSLIASFFGLSNIEVTQDNQELLQIYERLSVEDKKTVLSFAKFKYLESKEK